MYLQKFQRMIRVQRLNFCDGGMMTVEVAGNARTTSKGWETTQQEGKTLFRKYGKAETLKITK